MTVKLLFVCMGNICRSPSAEAVMRREVERAGLADRVEIDSAGTHSYHLGLPPDRRSSEAAAARGLDLSNLRARQVSAQDLQQWDYVLAMDSANLEVLNALRQGGNGGRAHVARLLDYAPLADTRDVPDPYYGGVQGFERVLDLIESGCEGLLEDVQKKHFSSR